MATSITQFNIELYREHLEEASFLYDQRQAYLHDPEINWPALHDWEDRIEAQIDALVVGGDPALEICRRQAADGEAGEKYAALRVFCRQKRKDLAFAVFGAVDPAKEAVVRAVSEALCRDASPGWRDDLLRVLRSDRPHLTPVLARVAGYRRFASEDILTSKLAEKPSIGRAELAWALGRVGTSASITALWPLVNDDDERVAEAGAMALMRIGDDRPLQRAMVAAETHSWARRVLAIGGDPRAVPILLDVVKSASSDADAVIGLGLLGDLTAVAPLLDLLDDEKLSESAAVALNTITGARQYSTVFVPDEIDPDELTDEERAAYEKDGTLPTRNGKPLGNFERHPLRDRSAWRSWLDENKNRFNRQLRWRMGEPYGPTALFECLRCETSPYNVRSATYEELVVRYGLDVPFEVDLLVHQQMRMLTKIGGWIAARTTNFANGRWYFGGRVHG